MKNRLISAIVVAAVLAAFPFVAGAQGIIQQLGVVSAGQIAMYIGNAQVIGTGGSPGPGLSPPNQANPGTLPPGLAIVNSGQGLALYSGYATGAAYSSLLFGFDGSGNPLITAAGNAATNITLSVGGFTYPLVGNNNSPAPWSTEIHQNGGGSCYGHNLCWGDQNVDFVGDHLTIQTQDASMITYVTVGGSITAGDIVGLNWQVASTTYNIRYTVQAADTTSTIASNLASCINAGSGTHCTVTSGFLAALLAFHDANGFGYKPNAAGNAFGASGRLSFDQPWAASGNSIATSLSGGATETLTVSSGNILDNGPYMATSRYVQGRTPVAGDQLGTFYFQGQSAASSGIDTVYAALLPRVLVQNATNPQGELQITTSDSASAKNLSPKIFVGSGVNFADSAGANCGYLGLGIARVCGQLAIYSTVNPQVLWQASGANDFQAVIESGAAKNAYFQFRDGGVNKFQLKKDTSNNISLFDNVNSGNGWTVGSGGIVTLGEGGQISIPLSGGPVTVSSTLAVSSTALNALTVQGGGSMAKGFSFNDILNVAGVATFSAAVSVGALSTAGEIATTSALVDSIHTNGGIQALGALSVGLGATLTGGVVAKGATADVTSNAGLFQNSASVSVFQIRDDGAIFVPLLTGTGASGGLYVCYDAAGFLYKKASCP